MRSVMPRGTPQDQLALWSLQLILVPPSAVNRSKRNKVELTSVSIAVIVELAKALPHGVG